MSDLNPVMEDSSAEASMPEKRISKPRVSMPRNSLLISGAVAAAAAAAGGRGRRQSSRTSIPRAGLDRRLIRYENTFRMDPNDENRVDLARLRRVVSSVIESSIGGYKYDPNQGKQFSLVLADLVRSQVKHMPFARHKAVVQVVLGQKKGQDLRVASRCMWDLKVDRHITITKETNEAFVSVTIFLVYTE